MPGWTCDMAIFFERGQSSNVRWAENAPAQYAQRPCYLYAPHVPTAYTTATVYTVQYIQSQYVGKVHVFPCVASMSQEGRQAPYLRYNSAWVHKYLNEDWYIQCTHQAFSELASFTHRAQPNAQHGSMQACKQCIDPALRVEHVKERWRICILNLLVCNQMKCNDKSSVIQRRLSPAHKRSDKD